MKTVVGKLSRMLQVRVLPGAPSGAVLGSISTVVGVAQLVEPRLVMPVVAGSSPVIHPITIGGAFSSVGRAGDS